MGKLTTHVLDTARGKPGAGIAIQVERLEGDQRELVASAITNADGRCDSALLEGADLRVGEYEMHFSVGAYLVANDMAEPASGPRFLDTVVLRFGVSNADEHYHVPLLVSPFAYSTYRGS